MLMYAIATVGERSCVGVQSCYEAGEHRPYSYIRMYFLTVTNPQSWFNYLTGYDSGSATIDNDSWYVVLVMFYFFIFNLLIEISSPHLLSFSFSSNSNDKSSCIGAGKHRPHSNI